MNGELVNKLSESIGHNFAQPSLLDEALTHPSADSAQNYERMEFLGDRVLGIVIAEWLFEIYPAESEGELAPRYNEMVRGEQLAEIAQSLDLGGCMRIGKGEAESLRQKSGLLANVCEALIAAIFLDGGFEAARTFIREQWASAVLTQTSPPKDAKSELQEWAMARSLPLPAYRETARSGPMHALEFTIEVSVDGKPPETGTGRSKKAAESMAAESLLNRLLAGR